LRSLAPDCSVDSCGARAWCARADQESGGIATRNRTKDSDDEIRVIILAAVARQALGAVAAIVAYAGEWTLGTAENQTTVGTTIAYCDEHSTQRPVEISAEGIDCLKKKDSTMRL
jgi:hypothetical protein